MAEQSLVPVERLEQAIIVIRGHKVLLDTDVAALYGVETRRLNEQVRRNAVRFPPDFMFQLTAPELENLKSQIATSSSKWGGQRKLPFAFTEHGAIMAASVLNSTKAVDMSILVVRAFVRLRRFLSTHKELATQLAELERKLTDHDQQILALVKAIRQLMEPSTISKKRRIGFA